jgi:tRNA A-37 threonylcarbamoyl transferase component Bud32
LRFIRERHLAFPDIDEKTFQVTNPSGGSNLTYNWEFKDKQGREIKYFVKIFLPSGTIFATMNHFFSPFPKVRAAGSHQRFVVDIAARFLMFERNIPTVKMIIFDPIYKMMITECLCGVTVDTILKQASERKFISEEDCEIIRSYGSHLGEIHAQGFSLIDTPATNCMWLPERKRVIFTDMEFFTYEDFRMWDLGFALCSFMVFLDHDLATDAKKTFLEGYVQHAGVKLEQFKQIKQDIEDFLPLYRLTLNADNISSADLFEQIFA